MLAGWRASSLGTLVLSYRILFNREVCREMYHLLTPTVRSRLFTLVEREKRLVAELQYVEDEKGSERVVRGEREKVTVEGEKRDCREGTGSHVCR